MERLLPQQKTRNLTVLVVLYLTAIAVFVTTWVVTSRLLVAIAAAAVAVLGTTALSWAVAHGRRLLRRSTTVDLRVPRDRPARSTARPPS